MKKVNKSLAFMIILAAVVVFFAFFPLETIFYDTHTGGLLESVELDIWWHVKKDVQSTPYPHVALNSEIGVLHAFPVEFGHYGNRIYVRAVSPDGTISAWKYGTKEWSYNDWPEDDIIPITINLKLNKVGWWKFETYQQEKGGSLGGIPGWTTNYEHNDLKFFVGPPIVCYQCQNYKMVTKNFYDLVCPTGWNSSTVDCSPPILTLTVKDSVTQLWLTDVSITINSITNYTDAMGQVKFNLVPGTYKMNIEKEGYHGMENITYVMGTTDDSQTLLLIPKTEPEPPEEPDEPKLPGFELLTFLVSCGIAFMVLKRRK